MKQGKFITTYAPYGYRLEGGGLVVDQTESLVVKWIYERFLNGDSYAQIADTLNLHGIAKGKSTVGWTESGIQCILSNEKIYWRCACAKDIYDKHDPVSENGQ